MRKWSGQKQEAFFEYSPLTGLHWCKVPCAAEIFMAPFCSRGAKTVEVGKENKERSS